MIHTCPRREHGMPWWHGAISRWGVLALACTATLLFGLIGATAAGANAKRGLTTGFSGPIFSSADGAQRATQLDEARAAGADAVRIVAHWPSIERRRPVNPRNPADPAYDFERLDASIRDAQARGLRVLLMIRHVPSWVEGADRPPVSDAAPAGTWRPRPEPGNDFGHAIARRYSGSFASLTNPGSTLPRVRHFQVFNEPNLRLELSPQWEGNRPTSALVYRRVLNAFFRGIKSVHQSNVVVTGGTAPYGEDAGGQRMRPLHFWRTVMCLRPNLRRASCPGPSGRARFNVLAHHPINTSGGPFRSALHPDDISSPDLWKLRRALRAAERHGTIRPGGRRPLWVDEFWWETDPHFGERPPISLRRQARWIQESLYLFWRHGARVAMNFLVRDGTPAHRTRTTMGVYHIDGTRKPAFRAFRFPFVALDRGRRVELWGKAPRRGRVIIRRGSPGNWKRVTRVRSGANRVFRTRVRMRGKPRLQARARGGATSLIYKVR